MVVLDIELIAFISAFGFVSAAILCTLLYDIEDIGDIRIPENIPALLLVTLPVVAFTGPYWVAKASFLGFSHHRIAPLLCGLGFTISLVWSFCAGVFVVEFLHLLQVV